MKLRIIYIILFLPLIVAGQESVRKKQSVKSNSAVFELSKSLEQNLPADTIAADYEKVAREYIEKKDFTKAEESLLNARKLYLQNNNKEKIAYIEREIARAQEWQGNHASAIQSYQNAARLSTTSLNKELNENDAKRLLNILVPSSQSAYIQRNIDLLNTEPNTDKKEKVLAYQQMAQVSSALDDKEAVYSNLQSAINVADEPSQRINLKREIANVYASENKMDEAITINREILEEAEEAEDAKVQIEQLQTLSSAYIGSREIDKGIASLQQAYDIAVKEGHTLDAKNSLELLVTQYKRQNNNQKALEVYADFMGKLEALVKADSSLVDEKIFQVHEDRIARLEKERVLKDELIRKQNNVNLILIASIVLAFIFLLFIGKALYSIKKKNKKIALQSLRREMNPHFIFNSLNSVNQFIAQNNELEANRYLSSYSKLMRNMMENSNKDFTPLSIELEQLKEYLELEQMRFKDKFTYEITVDEALDADNLLVPNMLIQPQLENAIWHGLRYKDNGGLLQLSVCREGKGLLVRVEDNGIGLKKSQELKTKHQMEHKSRGLTNTRERIALLNSLYNCHIQMDITDKPGEEKGVIVILMIR